MNYSSHDYFHFLQCFNNIIKILPIFFKNFVKFGTQKGPSLGTTFLGKFNVLGKKLLKHKFLLKISHFSTNSTINFFYCNYEKFYLMIKYLFLFVSSAKNSIGFNKRFVVFGFETTKLPYLLLEVKSVQNNDLA